jgi:hypothetical protein
MHCLAIVFMGFHCVLTWETYTFGIFSNVYKNTHVPYFTHEMLCFVSVFMCFHCVLTAETCIYRLFYMYTRIHMYHTWNMKCTVLLVFSSVFTVFWQEKHVLFVHFICFKKYTCTILYRWNALFCKCFHLFWLFSHLRNKKLWYISHVYKNTHVPFFIHEMHCFASVFTVFTLQKQVLFGIFYMYTRIHMYHTLYMRCTLLLVFSYVFTVFSLQKHLLLIHFTCIPKYTCTIYYIWNAQFC